MGIILNYKSVDECLYRVLTNLIYPVKVEACGQRCKTVFLYLKGLTGTNVLDSTSIFPYDLD